MREEYKSRLMTFFMQAIGAKADRAAQAAARSMLTIPTFRHSRRLGSKHQKGYSNHNPAGTKVARMAASQAIGMRGRVQLS